MNHIIETTKILNSPCTSFWLKEALESALNRDPADVAFDAKLLAEVLMNRLNSMKG